MEKVRYTFGPYRLSLPERRLWLSEKAVKLEPRELDLLLFFVNNAGVLVTKETLREKIWDGASLHDTTIPTAISHLRKALEAGDDEIEYIKGVPSKGYYFVCSVMTEKMVTVDKELTAVKESAEVETAGIDGPDKNEQVVGFVGVELPLPESRVIKSNGGLDVLAALPEGERADIFFDLGLKASARMMGAEQNTWLDFVHAERENFAEALSYYGRTSSGRELELAVSLAFYWDLRGLWSEGRERFRHALARQAECSPEVKARAFTWFGYLSFHLDDYQTAKQALSEGVATSKEIGDDAIRALALHALAGVAEAEGKYPQAEAIYKQSLHASKCAKTDWIMGRTYRGLGSTAQSEGDYASAKEFFLKSLAKREEVDDRRGVASSYSRLSVIAVAQKDLAQARFLLDKSHETVYGTPGKQSVALAQFNQGLIEEAAGQYQPALAAFQRSLALRLQLGEKRGVARAAEATGKMMILLGNEKEAARILGAADALRLSTAAPLSPSEARRYGWLRLEAQKKFPQEWNDGRQRVLEEMIVV